MFLHNACAKAKEEEPAGRSNSGIHPCSAMVKNAVVGHDQQCLIKERRVRLGASDGKRPTAKIGPVRKCTIIMGPVD